MRKARTCKLVTLFILLISLYPVIDAFEIYIETGEMTKTEYEEGKQLIKEAIDTNNVNLQDAKGNNCIILAVKCAVEMPYLNKDRTGNAIRSEDLETLSNLIALGADINWANKRKWTPLQFAVITQKYEIVKLLLEEGAKIQETTRENPLALAAETGNVAIAKLLLTYGAKPNAPNALPLIVAALKHDRDMVLFLMRAGANPYKKLRDKNALDAANLCHKLILHGLKTEYHPNLKTAHIYRIDFEDTNLKVVLKALLHGLRGYKITFEDDIPVDEYIYTGKIADLSVEKAIAKVLDKFGLEYKVSGKELIVKKKKSLKEAESEK